MAIYDDYAERVSTTRWKFLRILVVKELELIPMNEPGGRAHPTKAGGDCVNLDLVPAAINSGVARVRVQHDVRSQHAAVYGLK